MHRYSYHELVRLKISIYYNGVSLHLANPTIITDIPSNIRLELDGLSNYHVHGIKSKLPYMNKDTGCIRMFHNGKIKIRTFERLTMEVFRAIGNCHSTINTIPGNTIAKLKPARLKKFIGIDTPGSRRIFNVDCYIPTSTMYNTMDIDTQISNSARIEFPASAQQLDWIAT